MNAIKISFLLFVFVFTTTYLSAQLGIRAGVSFSDQLIENNEYTEASGILGYSAGIMVEIKMSNRFAIQPELHFIQKGAFITEDDPFTGVEREADYIINSLMLALMTRYDVVSFGESGSIYLSAVPFFSYGMDVLVKPEFGRVAGTSEFDQSVKNRNVGWRRADYGIGAGLGIRFGGWVLDARYNYGLANIERRDIERESYSRVILIGLGYYF